MKGKQDWGPARWRGGTGEPCVRGGAFGGRRCGRVRGWGLCSAQRRGSEPRQAGRVPAAASRRPYRGQACPDGCVFCSSPHPHQAQQSRDGSQLRCRLKHVIVLGKRGIQKFLFFPSTKQASGETLLQALPFICDWRKTRSGLRFPNYPGPEFLGKSVLCLQASSWQQKYLLTR